MLLLPTSIRHDTEFISQFKDKSSNLKCGLKNCSQVFVASDGDTLGVNYSPVVKAGHFKKSLTEDIRNDLIYICI